MCPEILAFGEAKGRRPTFKKKKIFFSIAIVDAFLFYLNLSPKFTGQKRCFHEN